MIRSQTFTSVYECTRYMHEHGLTPADVHGPFLDNSGHLYIVYMASGSGSPGDDGGGAVLPASGGSYGVSVATGEVSTAGVVLEIGELRTVAVDEVLEGATGTLGGGGYVIPRTVVIVDDGHHSPVIKDNGVGDLVRATDGQNYGTIDYATGVYAINYRWGEDPAGDLTAAYSHSSLPDSAAVPDKCALSHMIIETTSGNLTSCSWAIYEESTQTLGPVFTGTADMLITAPHKVDFGNAVSVCLDKTHRGKRWISVKPDADGEVLIRLYWKKSEA